MEIATTSKSDKWGRHMLGRYFSVSYTHLDVYKRQDERSAGEEPVFISGQLKGCAPLYPLPVIIALSFLLDSTEDVYKRQE